MLDRYRALSDSRYRGPPTTTAGVDARALHRPAQFPGGTGEILQQLDIHVKVDKERQILLTQHFLQKHTAHLLFHGQDPGLAPTGVQQDAEGERQITFGGEELDRLLGSVLAQRKVVLAQIRDQRTALVFHIEEDVDHVHVHLERRVDADVDRLVLALTGGRLLLRWR